MEPRTHFEVSDLPPGNSAAKCLGPDGSAAQVDRAFRMLEGRWKLAIVFRLFGSPVMRFSELEKSLERVSQKVLTQQLRELERDGIVVRTVYPVVPPRVEYRLTERGEALKLTLRALREWSVAG